MRCSFPIAVSMPGAVLAQALVLSLALLLPQPAAAQDYQVMAANLFGEGFAGGGAAKDGSGDFDGEIDFRKKRICYYLEVSDIDAPTEAHIHEGDEKDDRGPIVLNLPLPPEPGDEACADASEELLRAIAAKPTEYYVDVHTGKYPEGAVRGQFRE